ncbi:MAG: hypothetical protein O3A25_18915 [Acidobacteria bacterium]|nr:hypothetical protein [Acidobacteriota bacterium]
MAVIHNPESEFAKEMARWNAPKRLGGHNANGFEAFPKMLYKAHLWTNGKPMVGHVDQTDEASSFTQRCQMTVFDADELRQAQANGWSDHPTTALDAFETAEQTVARAAAEEQFRVRRMGEQAQAEFTTAQEASHRHDPDPAPPKKRPGRPKKVESVS